METTHPLRVLVNPRVEFARVAEPPSLVWFLLLSATAGMEREFSELFEKAAPERALRPLIEVFALHAVLGSLRGIVALGLLAVLIATATRLMRHPLGSNQSSNANARSIIGWALLPSALPLVFLWALFAARGADFLRLGGDAFKAESPGVWWAVLALQLVSGVWSLVLVLLGVSAVSKLSLVRSIGAYAMAAVTFWALLNIGMFGVQWLAPVGLEALATWYAQH